MAVLFHGGSSFGAVAGSFQSEGVVNLLTDYGIPRPHPFRGLDDFKKICNKFYTSILEEKMEKTSMKGDTPYLGFIEVTPMDIDNIDNIRSEIPRMRILYVRDERVLIMKFIVGVAHYCVSRLLGSEFALTVRDRVGNQLSLLPTGSGRFQGAGGNMKEADESYKPLTRVHVGDWPSITFEVGVSERLPQLRQDAHFWLEDSGGLTRIVILAYINEIAKTIAIERWQNVPALVAAPATPPATPPARQQPSGVPNPYSRTVIPTCVQDLLLEEGVPYVGPSLTIPATLVYDILPPVARPALGPNDFDISAQTLDFINIGFWTGMV